MPDDPQPGSSPRGLRVEVRARAIHRSQARRLERELRRLLAALGIRDGEVSARLVGDAAMRRLNRAARGIDRTTDVLSFPAAKVPGSTLLGDLVISVPVGRKSAARLGRRLGDELALYAAHGLLHLMGHDHRTRRGRAEMESLERRLLGEDGLIARR